MRIANLAALVLVIVGALNWLLVGLLEWDLVAEIFGEELGTANAGSRIVYIVVGAAGLFLLGTLVPRLARAAAEDAHYDARTGIPGR